MNRLEKEAVSRIAMVVMAILLMAVAAGMLVVVIALIHSDQVNELAVTLLGLSLALIAAGVYLLIGCFRPSVNIEREPDDPRYRIK